MTWKTVKLTEIATISTGKWDANHASKNGKYRFYTCASKHLYSETKRFSGNCIILPGNGANVGDVYYYEGDFDAYQRTYVVHDIKISAKFLMYHMKMNWWKTNKNKQYGSATNFIKIGNFKDYNVSYPPQKEQQRIVAKLNVAFAEIDKAIASSSDQKNNIISLEQKIIDKNFSDFGKSITFDEIVLNKGTGLERRATLQSSDRKYPYLKMNNINKNNQLELEKFTSIDADETEIQKYSLKKEDFLFNTRNSVELVGKSAVFNDERTWLFNNNILRVKFKSGISSKFVNFFLSSTKGKKQLEGMKTGTTNVAAIYYKDLRTIQIPLVSLEAQEKIVEDIESTFNHTSFLRQTFKQKIFSLYTLKSAILKRELLSEAV